MLNVINEIFRPYRLDWQAAASKDIYGLFDPAKH